MRLVCLPWLGGGASAYCRFAHHMLPGYELLAVQYPGREDRFGEQPLLLMESLVRHILANLVPDAARPTILFGHGLGALVAYEVAVALKRRTGREPKALIVSGAPAPHLGLSLSRRNAGPDMLTFRGGRGRRGKPISQVLEKTEPKLPLSPPLLADYQVLENYRPQPAGSLSCPLIACAGDQDVSISPESLSAWEAYSTGLYRQRWISGGSHFYLCADPRALARILAE